MVDDPVSGQVDGSTEPPDLDRTEQNKRLVTGFLNDVLKNKEYDKLTEYVSATSPLCLAFSRPDLSRCV